MTRPRTFRLGAVRAQGRAVASSEGSEGSEEGVDDRERIEFAASAPFAPDMTSLTVSAATSGRHTTRGADLILTKYQDPTGGHHRWTVRFTLPAPPTASNMWIATLASDSDGIVPASVTSYIPVLAPGRSVTVGNVFRGGIVLATEVDVGGSANGS
jgi:hypothetical protein